MWLSFDLAMGIVAVAIARAGAGTNSRPGDLSVSARRSSRAPWLLERWEFSLGTRIGAPPRTCHFAGGVCSHLVLG
jgi:hypothetical protein